MDQNQSFNAHTSAHGCRQHQTHGAQSSSQQTFSHVRKVLNSVRPAQRGILIGRPIPKDFFLTKGKGESKHGVHAGSYHIALQEAGIEKANIMAYSSILPGIANRISKEDGMKQIQHGEEMKVIQAAASVDLEKGEKRATAAIMYGWLFPKNGGPTVGGLVCEYSGNGTVEEAHENLRLCLDGLYQNPDLHGVRFSDEYELRDTEFISETIEPTQRYGTALAIIAFVNHVVPVLDENFIVQPKEVMVAVH
jgi:arginine decarboxylase